MQFMEEQVPKAGLEAGGVFLVKATGGMDAAPLVLHRLRLPFFCHVHAQTTLSERAIGPDVVWLVIGRIGGRTNILV